MPHSIRRYISGKPYEVTFRAKKGFPLPPKHIIEALFKSALARTQRDLKVHICHLIVMANHVHIFIIIKDAHAAVNFYKELQKNLTDSIKALLGINSLTLWGGRPNVMQVEGIDSAILKIAYFYANPSRADLVETIGHYPGISSYKDYVSSPNTVTAKVSEVIPWIRTPAIEALPSSAPSERQDRFIADKLKKQAKKKHTLTLEPNLWLQCFGDFTDDDVAEVKRKVLEELRGREFEYAQKRQKDSKMVSGVNRLKKMTILQYHIPEKNKGDRRVFIYCRDKAVRIAMILEFKAFAAACKQRYSEWSVGDFSRDWPTGGFRPPMPPLANALW